MAVQPDYAVPTGEFIAEWMEDNSVNAAELSRRLGVSRKHISELLSGKASLSHDLALALERVTGVPARIWNQYEALYQEDRARLSSRKKLADQYEAARAFPLRYLRRHGYLEADARDRAGTVAGLLALFGVASVDAWHQTWERGSVAYRRTLIERERNEELATWLVLGERAAAVDSLPDYDEAALKGLLSQLRSLTREDPSTYLDRAVDMLAEVGVSLCFVPAVPGLGVYGATRWLDGHPIIQLSLRGRTDDQLWFTVFHEIGHVLLHSRGGLYLDSDHDAAEADADRFAADTLIPPDVVEWLPRSRNIAAVREIAESIGVAPGVVLGRIHRETGDFAWGHQLKQRFEFRTVADEPDDDEFDEEQR